MRAVPIRFAIVWLALLAAHAALALAPFVLYQSSATALLPYYSYFGVLSVLSELGVEVLGEFTEGMFMAPVATVGKVAVVAVWLVFHALLAATVVWVSRRFASARESKNVTNNDA